MNARKNVPFTRPLFALLLTATMFASGCLSTAHKIPRNELIRLSQTQPEERGKKVRVIQAFSNNDGPPEQARVGPSTVVIVNTGPNYGPGYRGNRYSGSTGAFRSGGSQLASNKKEASKYWFIIAAVAALGLAMTEGARYDGWVELHPMHPVHLFGPYGEYMWLPLAQIDPQTAAWAQNAMVRPSEGPWNQLGRAPLNRRGFHYGVFFGASEIPSHAEERLGLSDSDRSGFQGHIQAGYFPTQTIGFAFDVSMGFRDNAEGNTLYENRFGLEIQAFPLQVGRFHFGGYGDIGWATRLEDGANGRDKATYFLGGGATAQLEIFTRLALTGRAGLAYVFGHATSEAVLGLSIY